MTVHTLAQAAPAAQTKAAPQTSAPAAVKTGTKQPDVPAGGEQTAQPQGILGGLGGMVPFIVIMGVFIYLMWSGQRKERKKKEDLLSSIKVGDQVVTIGGIMGEVATVKEDHFVIRISDSAKIKVVKSAVNQVVREEASAQESKGEKK